MSFDFDQLPTEDSAVIEHHSRSFSLAARMLPAKIRPDVEKLYAWCRWCDDAVDSAPDVESAKARLDLLRADVQLIYEGANPVHAASNWLASVVKQYKLPIELPLDLLAGMETDLVTPVFQSVDELLLYCYRAAGTVGLMMCRIMGVTDPRAFPKAEALGIAMQLTNIARDIKEDWQRGRRYLPAKWLPLTPQKHKTPSNQEIRPAVEQLLKLADSYYATGLSGLEDLPHGARYAIRLAAKVYQEIGNEIRRRDFQVMDQRVYVPNRQKLVVAAKCLISEIQFRIEGFYRRFKTPPVNTLTPVNFFSRGHYEMKNETRYLFYLGLSLTLIMATTLFTLVGINPKDSSYQSLPWIYAVACAVLAGLTGLMARRCNHLFEIEKTSAKVRVVDSKAGFPKSKF